MGETSPAVLGNTASVPVNHSIAVGEGEEQRGGREWAAPREAGEGRMENGMENTENRRETLQDPEQPQSQSHGEHSCSGGYEDTELEEYPEIICFRLTKDPYAGKSTPGCTKDHCNCDKEQVKDNLRKLVNAVITIGICREKMCPNTVREFLCESNLYGLYFTWLELDEEEEEVPNTPRAPGVRSSVNDSADNRSNFNSSNAFPSGVDDADNYSSGDDLYPAMGGNNNFDELHNDKSPQAGSSLDGPPGSLPVADLSGASSPPPCENEKSPMENVLEESQKQYEMTSPNSPNTSSSSGTDLKSTLRNAMLNISRADIHQDSDPPLKTAATGGTSRRVVGKEAPEKLAAVEIKVGKLCRMLSEDLMQLSENMSRPEETIPDTQVAGEGGGETSSSQVGQESREFEENESSELAGIILEEDANNAGTSPATTLSSSVTLIGESHLESNDTDELMSRPQQSLDTTMSSTQSSTQSSSQSSTQSSSQNSDINISNLPLILEPVTVMSEPSSSVSTCSPPPPPTTNEEEIAPEALKSISSTAETEFVEPLPVSSWRSVTPSHQDMSTLSGATPIITFPTTSPTASDCSIASSARLVIDEDYHPQENVDDDSILTDHSTGVSDRGQNEHQVFDEPTPSSSVPSALPENEEFNGQHDMILSGATPPSSKSTDVPLGSNNTELAASKDRVLHRTESSNVNRAEQEADDDMGMEKSSNSIQSKNELEKDTEEKSENQPESDSSSSDNTAIPSDSSNGSESSCWTPPNERRRSRNRKRRRGRGIIREISISSTDRRVTRSCSLSQTIVPPRAASLRAIEKISKCNEMTESESEAGGNRHVGGHVRAASSSQSSSTSYKRKRLSNESSSASSTPKRREVTPSPKRSPAAGVRGAGIDTLLSKEPSRATETSGWESDDSNMSTALSDVPLQVRLQEKLRERRLFHKRFKTSTISGYTSEDSTINSEVSLITGRKMKTRPSIFSQSKEPVSLSPNENISISLIDEDNRNDEEDEIVILSEMPPPPPPELRSQGGIQIRLSKKRTRPITAVSSPTASAISGDSSPRGSQSPSQSNASSTNERTVLELEAEDETRRVISPPVQDSPTRSQLERHSPEIIEIDFNQGSSKERSKKSSQKEKRVVEENSASPKSSGTIQGNNAGNSASNSRMTEEISKSPVRSPPNPTTPAPDIVIPEPPRPETPPTPLVPRSIPLEMDYVAPVVRHQNRNTTVGVTPPHEEVTVSNVVRKSAASLKTAKKLFFDPRQEAVNIPRKTVPSNKPTLEIRRSGLIGTSSFVPASGLNPQKEATFRNVPPSEETRQNIPVHNAPLARGTEREGEAGRRVPPVADQLTQEGQSAPAVVEKVVSGQNDVRNQPKERLVMMGGVVTRIPFGSAMETPNNSQSVGNNAAASSAPIPTASISSARDPRNLDPRQNPNPPSQIRNGNIHNRDTNSNSDSFQSRDNHFFDRGANRNRPPLLPTPTSGEIQHENQSQADRAENRGQSTNTTYFSRFCKRLNTIFRPPPPPAISLSEPQQTHSRSRSPPRSDNDRSSSSFMNNWAPMITIPSSWRNPSPPRDGPRHSRQSASQDEFNGRTREHRDNDHRRRNHYRRGNDHNYNDRRSPERSRHDGRHSGDHSRHHSGRSGNRRSRSRSPPRGTILSITHQGRYNNGNQNPWVQSQQQRTFHNLPVPLMSIPPPLPFLNADFNTMNSLPNPWDDFGQQINPPQNPYF